MDAVKEALFSNLPKGFCALVQGGSRGIGLGFVKTLSRLTRCGHVVATCRDPASSEALQKLQRESPERVTLLPLNLTSPTSVENFGASLREQFSQLHLVLNVSGLLHNREAGISPEKRVESLSLASMRSVFEVNAFGPMLVAKETFPLLRHKETSLFASVSARVGSIGDNRLGGWYSYRASKAALNMFSKTLSIETSRRSPETIVICLHPGTTDTDLSAPFQRNVPPEKLFSVEKSVGLMSAVLTGLTREDSGSFLAWDGSKIEW